MREHFVSFFGIGDPWRRPRPPHWLRHDLIIAAAFLVFAAVGLEVTRSAHQLADNHHAVWVQYAPLLIGAVTLTVRRRLPLTVMLLLGANMFVTGVTMPNVMIGTVVQMLYLFGFFSAVAWGHPRGRTVVASGLLVLFMFSWIAWQFHPSSEAVAHLHALDRRGTVGLFDAVSASVIGAYIVNSIYFFGAIGVGAMTWRGARQHAELVDQARTITEQSHRLKDQAVVDERLRIARELHDVVAHHVSVIGVQAGAARKVLDKKPAAAQEALGQIESSSRSAVGEMRNLLGTLRATGPDERAPGPAFDDIPSLIEQFRTSGMPVELTVVDDDPSLADEVPAAVGLGLYRTTQEALSNVRRHSTASTASVSLRLGREEGRAYAETEVLDAGRPRPQSEGSGLGLVGMRERVAAHGGTAEIGPRATGGYRVRVRLPFPDPHGDRSDPAEPPADVDRDSSLAPAQSTGRVGRSEERAQPVSRPGDQGTHRGSDA